MEAIRLIYAGINEAINYNVKYCSDGKKSLFGNALSVTELETLCDSLRDPQHLDMDMWAYALTVFQDHIVQRNESSEIDIVEILVCLEEFKKNSIGKEFIG